MLKMQGTYKGDATPSPSFPPPSSSSPGLPPPSLSLFPATPEQQSNFLAHLNASSHVPPLPQGLLSHLSANSKSLQPAPRWYTDPPSWPDHTSNGAAALPDLASQHHQPPPQGPQHRQPPAAAASWMKDHSIFSSPSPHSAGPFSPASSSHRPVPVPVLPGHMQDAMAPAPPSPFLSPFLATFSGPSLSELQHLQQLANRLPAAKAAANAPPLPTDVSINGFRHGNSSGVNHGSPSSMDPMFSQHASRFSSMQSQLQLRSPGFPDGAVPRPTSMQPQPSYGNQAPLPPPLLLPEGMLMHFPAAPPSSTNFSSSVMPTFIPPFGGSHRQPPAVSQPPPLGNGFSSAPSPSRAVSNVPLASAPAFVDPSFAAWAQQLQSEDRGLCLIKLLLSCADAAASTNMNLTNQILEQLSLLSNLTGDPMQRVATYFMKGLAARITKAACPGIYKALNSTDMPSLPDLLAARQVFFGVCPYLKFAFLAVNQAIMDVMQVHKMVHVVDLEAIDAVQWVALLQALAARPGGPPHLRISGVSERRDLLEKLGQQLSDEAGRLGVPFQFHAIVVRIEDLTKEMLRLKPGEALAVSSVMRLHLLLALDEECQVALPRSTVAVGEKQTTSQGVSARGGSAPFTFHNKSIVKDEVPSSSVVKPYSHGNVRVDVGLNLSGASNSSNSGTSFKAPSSDRNGFTAWAGKSENGIRSSADSVAVVKKEQDLFSNGVKRDGVDQPEDSGHGSGFSLWSVGAPAGREREVVSRRSPTHSGDESRHKQTFSGRSEQGKDSPKHFLSSFDRVQGGQLNSSPQRSGGHGNQMRERKGMVEVEQNGEVERTRAGTGDTSGTDVSTLTEEGSPAPERLLNDEKRDLVQRLYNAKHALLEKVHGGIDVNRRSEQNDCSYGRGGEGALDMNKNSGTGMNALGAAGHGGSLGTGKGNHWIGIDVNKASEESEEERRGEIDINRCFGKGTRMSIDVNSVEEVGAQSVQNSRGDHLVGRNNQTRPFQLESDRGVKRSSEQMEEAWKLNRKEGDDGRGGASFIGFIGNSQRENDSRSAALRFHQERQLMAERGYPSVLAVGHYAGEKPVSFKQELSGTRPADCNGGQPPRGLMSALTAHPGIASSPSSKCSRMSADDDLHKLGGQGVIKSFALDHFGRKVVKEEQPDEYPSRGKFEGAMVKEENGHGQGAPNSAGATVKVKEDYSRVPASSFASGNVRSQQGDFPSRSFSRTSAISKVLEMLKGLHPKVMVVVEQDSSHNSPTLVERFVQALHYYGAMFDSLDSTLSQQSPERVILEKHLLGQEIHNIVACEGRDRLERHEKLEVWKRRMIGVGFLPLLFSQTTSVQAQRLLRNCFSDGYRMVEENGCLTLCWKNTPLFSASAWHSDFPLS